MSQLRDPRRVVPSFSWREYLRHSWHGIVVVTAIVTVAHHYHLFDPIDTYAFFVVSHFLGEPPRRTVSPRVLVASIDQPSYEQDYEERSPLDRCQLRDHLLTIYEPPPPTPKPTLVVVDVDLSPVRPLKTEEKPEEKPTCQDKLEALFVAGREAQIKTVLMKPFDVVTEKDTQAAWKSRMQGAGVKFGDASLPSNWGVAIKHHCERGFLAAAAYLADPPGSSSWLSSSCLSERPELAWRSFIDPVHYLAHLEIVSLARKQELKDQPVAAKRELQYRMAAALDRLAKASGDGRRVVFFGGGWGESDTYVTPVGELYGVEVHAAAFLSIGDPPRAMGHLFSALLEVLIAIVVGGAFTICWRRYFWAAMDASAAQREHSIVWLGALAGLTLVSFLVFVLFAWYLLSRGLWLSPIPLILGMTIDAFVESLREAALRARGEVSEGARGPSARLLVEYSSRTLAETPQGVVESFQEEAVWVAPAGTPSYNRVLLSRGVYEYFWGDAREMYESNEPKAQSALWIRRLKRLAGLGIVLYACWLVLPGKEAFMRFITAMLLVAILVAPGQAAEAQCRGLAAISGLSGAQFKANPGEVSERAKAGGTECASFRTVISKIIGRETTAGRRLETDRPFNPTAAQANVDAALRNPDVRKRIEALRSEVPDETVRLMFEAIVFDEEGYYDARELRIRQLRQGLN